MKEQLISFETAKLAKEKGFDWPCNLHYSCKTKELNSSKQELTQKSLRAGEFLAPAQSLLQKWLREKHNIYAEVEVFNKESNIFKFSLLVVIVDKHGFLSGRKGEIELCDSYEISLEKGLQEALKLIDNLM